ncbi:MAG: YaiO family outer membrane beta-barrel protein [Candidatus Cyclobacteriaceae bacterium M2_1C_046]
MIKFFITAFVSFISVFQLAAQQDIDLDSLFQEALNLAYNKEYAESRENSSFILKSAPGYSDAAILIGRTYAWQQNYDTAKIILTTVVEKNPTIDAFYALAQVEKWSGSIESSLEITNDGIEKDSVFIPLLILKAELLQQLNRDKEAQDVLNHVLIKDTQNKKASALLEQINMKQMNNHLMLNYQITTFSQNSSVRHITNIEYLKSASGIKYLGRISYAGQNEWNSFQAELEGYIPIKDKINIFLTTGIADGNFFPDYRAGGEISYLFPYSIETSLGARALFFNEGTVLLYTAHIGKYFKRNWISGRVFVQNQNDILQMTGILQIRHYFRNDDEYLSVIISKGTIPSTPFGRDEIYRMDASTVGLNGQFSLSDQFIFGAIMTFEYEEYLAESYRHRINMGVRILKKF